MRSTQRTGYPWVELVTKRHCPLRRVRGFYLPLKMRRLRVIEPRFAQEAAIVSVMGSQGTGQRQQGGQAGTGWGARVDPALLSVLQRQ